MKGSVVLKIWHKFVLLAVGLLFLIASMSVFEKYFWLFVIFAFIGLVFVHVALEGGKVMRRLTSQKFSTGTLVSEPSIKKYIF